MTKTQAASTVLSILLSLGSADTELLEMLYEVTDDSAIADVQEMFFWAGEDSSSHRPDGSCDPTIARICEEFEHKF